MTWEQWSRAVIDLLIETLEIPNGDAQAIFEAQPVLAVTLWRADYTPAQAAAAIDAASRTVKLMRDTEKSLGVKFIS